MPVRGDGLVLLAALLFLPLANAAHGVAEFVFAQRLLRVLHDVLPHPRLIARFHGRYAAPDFQRQRGEDGVRNRELSEANAARIPAPLLSVGGGVRPVARLTPGMIRRVFRRIEVDTEG